MWEDVELSDKSDEDIDAVERNGLVSQVVLGIAFFLTYFHLLYHLSEVAIRTLLTFTRQLIHFLAIITHHDLLLQIMNCIPKSMNTIRNKFKEKAFVEYVVCPKCNKLYLLDDCTVNINSIKLGSCICKFGLTSLIILLTAAIFNLMYILISFIQDIRSKCKLFH